MIRCTSACRRAAAGLLSLVVVLAPSALTAAAPAAASCESTAPLPEESDLSANDRALLAVARQLPLDVKVGQLLMPGFVGLAPDVGLLDRARRGHVGGFFLLGRNVREAAQVQELTAGLAQAATEGSDGIMPFLAVDFEGGTVNALRAVTGPTTSAAVMATSGPVGVQVRGAQDAEALKSLGFNTDLAPVADVLTAPSAVIGTRAFSSDAGTVAALSRAYLRGLQGAGVLGVLKHFPGHGGTADDSHVLLPTVDRSREELESVDFEPYRQAIQASEAQAVMVGHLFVPALDPELPSSLSPAIVGGVLRGELGFDGLVMTDELKMGAISHDFGVTQAAVMALQAGVDVILADYTGAEQGTVEQALIAACASGQLPMGRLEQSVARVLRVKLAHGLAGEHVTALYAAQGGQETAGLPPVRSPRAAAPPKSPRSPAAPVQPDYGGVPLTGLPDGAAGRFYADAAGHGDFGYAITDEGGIALWQSYAALGGPDALGYPISQRFEFAGMTAQLTQRALLQWDPEQQRATVANAFELFPQAGRLLGWPGCESATEAAPGCSLDGWLELKGIPRTVADDGSDGEYRHAVAARLGWLENDALREAFLASPNGGAAAPWPDKAELAARLDGVPDERIPWPAIQRYGLPMSRPERFGPFVSQRFQRVTFQLWLDDVPGMPAPGTVTPVLAGELLREAGFVPASALVPATIDGSSGAPPDLPPPPTPPAPPSTPTPTASPTPAASATPAAPTVLPTAVSIQPTPKR